mgnify:CR=1 FL=1
MNSLEALFPFLNFLRLKVLITVHGLSYLKCMTGSIGLDLNSACSTLSWLLLALEDCFSLSSSSSKVLIDGLALLLKMLVLTVLVWGTVEILNKLTDFPFGSKRFVKFTFWSALLKMFSPVFTLSPKMLTFPMFYFLSSTVCYVVA